MSKISDLIFGGKAHYITSPFGKRNVISTSAGTTASQHNGTDYGTNGKKIAQYAIEEGKILSCGKAKDGALYVWVEYPRIGKKFLHYHLDSISVKTGQAVKKGAKLGTTGKTGKATGVHLHLGVKDLKTDLYEDPEKLVYIEPMAVVKYTATTEDAFLHPRGYFKKGDEHANIGKIAKFMRKCFPAYTNEKALGNKFGPNLLSSIKTFQKNTGLKADGKIGPLTLAMLKAYGFRY